MVIGCIIRQQIQPLLSIAQHACIFFPLPSQNLFPDVVPARCIANEPVRAGSQSSNRCRIDSWVFLHWSDRRTSGGVYEVFHTTTLSAIHMPKGGERASYENERGDRDEGYNMLLNNQLE